jgi:hypothetical protein
VSRIGCGYIARVNKLFALVALLVGLFAATSTWAASAASSHCCIEGCAEECAEMPQCAGPGCPTCSVPAAVAEGAAPAKALARVAHTATSDEAALPSVFFDIWNPPD